MSRDPGPVGCGRGEARGLRSASSPVARGRRPGSTDRTEGRSGGWPRPRRTRRTPLKACLSPLSGSGSAGDSANFWVHELPRYADRQQASADFWSILAGILAAITSLAIFPVVANDSGTLVKVLVSAFALAAAICALVPRVKNYAELAGQARELTSRYGGVLGNLIDLGELEIARQASGEGRHGRHGVLLDQGEEGHAPRPARPSEGRGAAGQLGGAGQRRPGPRSTTRPGPAPGPTRWRRPRTMRHATSRSQRTRSVRSSPGRRVHPRREGICRRAGSVEIRLIAPQEGAWQGERHG